MNKNCGEKIKIKLFGVHGFIEQIEMNNNNNNVM